MRRRISGWTVGVSLAILAAIAALVLWPKKEVVEEPVDIGKIIFPKETALTVDGHSTNEPAGMIGQSNGEWIDSAVAARQKEREIAEDRRIERIVRKVLKEQARSVKQTRDTTFPTRYIHLDSIIRSYQIDTAIRQGTIPNVVPMPMPMILDSFWRRCADPHESLPIWEDLRKRRIENRYPETTGGVWKGVPKP